MVELTRERESVCVSVCGTIWGGSAVNGILGCLLGYRPTQSRLIDIGLDSLCLDAQNAHVD